MELLFESRKEVVGRRGRLIPFQAAAQVSPEPVLRPDQEHDGGGCALYGTVLAEGGGYRMWYQAAPRDHLWNQDFSNVAVAESEDGLIWTKPAHGVLGSLTDLGLHSPAISKVGNSYLATGCAKRSLGLNPAAKEPGHYVAASRDGLHWELVSGARPLPGGDVITSIWDDRTQTGHAMLKHMRYHGGIQRRCLFEATFTREGWTDHRLALMPTEADDNAALQRGCRSADYYGMTFMPAGKTGLLGFVWMFYHQPPYYLSGSGTFGGSALVPVYREHAGAAWVFATGRQPFLEHPEGRSQNPFFYAASSVLTVGDEQRLYCTAFRRSHSWVLNEHRKSDPAVVEQLKAEGAAAIHLARWPRDRFFGFRAETEAEIILNLGPVTAPATLRLNYRTTSGGSVRASLKKGPQGEFIAGFSSLPEGAEVGWSTEDCVPLEGDNCGATVRWKEGEILPITKKDESLLLTVRLLLAECYAYEIVYH